jgi:hypothetical protein
MSRTDAWTYLLYLHGWGLVALEGNWGHLLLIMASLLVEATLSFLGFGVPPPHPAKITMCYI